MPYLVLIAGILAGIYALYKFFTTAGIPQIRKLIYVAASAGLSLVLLYFAVTGRILISLALLVVLFTFFLPYFRKNKDRLDDESDIIDVTPVSSDVENDED
ncbi:MAG: hypothetical protein KDI13_04090 [Alphaproteobacteria bacterium]|nr:hypothetical protein [Alphaproteobacteria bacterium]